MLVHADHFAIDDAGARQAALQRRHHVGELEVLRRMIAAEKGQLTPIETGENTQTVVLRLKDPGRVVERCGDERTEHRVELARHGCALELPCHRRQSIPGVPSGPSGACCRGTHRTPYMTQGPSVALSGARARMRHRSPWSRFAVNGPQRLPCACGSGPPSSRRRSARRMSATRRQRRPCGRPSSRGPC